MKIMEQVTIHKEDSTLSKLCKFCAWIGIILCFWVFAMVWLIFFWILGIPTTFYKLCYVIHKHRQNKKLQLIARKELENETN